MYNNTPSMCLLTFEVFCISGTVLWNKIGALQGCDEWDGKINRTMMPFTRLAPSLYSSLVTSLIIQAFNCFQFSTVDIARFVYLPAIDPPFRKNAWPSMDLESLRSAMYELWQYP